MFKNLTPTYKFILIVLLIIIVFFISFQAYKYFKSKRAQNLLDGNVVVAPAGTVSVNVGTKASEIHDALHGSMFYEDEQKAINAVLSTPKTFIPQLSSTYFALYGINLKEDLQEYLSASEWLQIQSQFN